jgi:hypothetical protein
MLTLSTASLGFGAPVVNCPADLAGEAIGISGTNICDGVASGTNRNPNIPCFVSGTVAALEQAATDVTVGYVGTNPNTVGVPITKPFYQAGLCPVNVHWHLGAEHRSAGQYDENGLGPINEATGDHAWAGDPVRMGNKCYNYDSNDQKFTAPVSSITPAPPLPPPSPPLHVQPPPLLPLAHPLRSAVEEPISGPHVP